MQLESVLSMFSLSEGALAASLAYADAVALGSAAKKNSGPTGMYVFFERKKSSS